MNQDEEFKQQIQANDYGESMSEFDQYKKWKDEHDPNKAPAKAFCPNCEKETECTHTAELYECEECGEDFAKYIVARNPNIKDIEQVGLREKIIGDALCENLRAELKEIKSNVSQFIEFIKTKQNAKAHLQMLVVETLLEEKPSNSDVSVTQNVSIDIKTSNSAKSDDCGKALSDALMKSVELRARLDVCEDALISMVRQFFYSAEGSNCFYHAFMSAEEEAAAYLVGNGIAFWNDEHKSSICFTEVDDD